MQSTRIDLLQTDAPLGPDQLGAPDVNRAGQTSGFVPDTNGDVGPNHYVQTVNIDLVGVYPKDNAGAAAFFTIRSLFPAADLCRTAAGGDPIVLYDHLADRWFLSQFTNTGGAQDNLCIAVSTSPDPNGTYYAYSIPAPAPCTGAIAGSCFPDYPKYAVWPDGYYMSSREFDVGWATNAVWAFDRSNMLAGFAAGFVRKLLAVNGTTVLPADLDGQAPPAGTPGFFANSYASSIRVYEFVVDWNNPGAATFGQVDNIAVAAFTTSGCQAITQPFLRDCIPQPGTAQMVDAIPGWLLYSLKFRYFDDDTYSMVTNMTVNVSANIPFVLGFTPGIAVFGIRWYEIQKDGAAGAWGVQQQGTYAPQMNGATADAQLRHHWMGSIAQDKNGNIALGYSITNSSNDAADRIFPGIRYTGHAADDLPGIMGQGERTIRTGTISQTAGVRWGDYTAMTVDPVDDCTFWYTNQVAGNPGNRATQIASFRFADCEQVDLAVTKVDDPDPVNAGEQLFYDIEVTNFGTNPATDVVVTDTLPAEVTYVTDTGGCIQPIMGGAVIICTIDEILPGDSFDFEIKVLVDPDVVAINGGPLAIDNHVEVTSPQPDVDDSNNEAWASTIVDDTADIKATKLCKPDRLLAAGEVGECTIFIDNHGPSWARNVYVLDSLVSDGDFTILGVEPAADCMAMATTWACALGDLAAAPSPNSRTEVVVTLMANDQVDINDLTFAMSDTFDPDYDNNQSHGSIQVQGIADLAITKTDDPDPVIAGTQLTYTLSVTNGGPSDAENVVINDILPAEVEVISVVGSHGAMCNAGVPGDASQPTSCAYGLIEVGAPARTMTIVVLVDPDALGVIQNDAEVVSDTFDSNNADNFDTETTTVEADADLEIAKEAIPNPLPHGDPLTYIVTITNNGPSTAVGVVLEDTLPEETTFLQATIFDGTGTCVQLGGMPRQINCSLNDLWPGDFVTVIIEVATEECLEHLSTIDNLAIASAVTPDSDLLNNTVLQETVIWNEADVSIDKDGPDEGYEWWPLTYTITVTNDGPQKACDVEVVDHLPKTPWKVAYMSTTGPCIYTKSEHRLDCDLGTLGIGEVVEFEVTVKPKIYWVWITNIVDVFTSSFDPDLNNNHDEHDTWISY